MTLHSIGSSGEKKKKINLHFVRHHSSDHGLNSCDIYFSSFFRSRRKNIWARPEGNGLQVQKKRSAPITSCDPLDDTLLTSTGQSCIFSRLWLQSYVQNNKQRRQTGCGSILNSAQLGCVHNLKLVKSVRGPGTDLSVPIISFVNTRLFPSPRVCLTSDFPPLLDTTPAYREVWASYLFFSASYLLRRRCRPPHLKPW